MLELYFLSTVEGMSSVKGKVLNLLAPGVTACQLNPWLGGDNRSGRLNT